MELKLADEVLQRLVQIVQEALLTGVDVSDILRQVRVVLFEDVDQSDGLGVLVLSPAYVKQVKETYDAMLARAEELKHVVDNITQN